MVHTTKTIKTYEEYHIKNKLDKLQDSNKQEIKCAA